MYISGLDLRAGNAGGRRDSILSSSIGTTMITIGVTAAGGGIGQSVLHALSRSVETIRTVAMDANRNSLGLYWADRAFLIPRVSEETYIEKLLEISRNEHIDILVPGLDIELPVLARHRERFLEQGCRVLVGSPEVVDLCRDKYSLSVFCRERGLPFVRTFLLEDARDLAETLDYPVIVKPRGGSASAGARLVFNPDQLQSIPADRNAIVQDYLPPRPHGNTAPAGKASTGTLDQSNELSIQFYVTGSGTILGGFASVNLLKNGIPVEIEPVPGHPALEESLPVVKALVEKGLRGPVNLQGRRTADGRVGFFEINPRFTGITGLRASFEYREVEAAVADLTLADDTRTGGFLGYRPGYFGMRYVADTIVPVEHMQNVCDVSAAGPVKSERKTGDVSQHVLVTGATGYFGANIVEELLNRSATVRVHALVRNDQGREKLEKALGEPERLLFMNGQLPDGLPDLHGIDTVVHAASERLCTDPSRFFLINTEGTRTLLEKMEKAGLKRLVYISSQAVYGTQSPPLWTEEMPIRPETPYASSKWMGEVLSLGDGYRVPEVIVLRVARLYGLGHFLRWEELPHKFAGLAAESKPLTVFGSENEIDLIHVKDAAAAVAAASLAEFSGPGKRVLNIGGGCPVTISRFAAICGQAAVGCGLDKPQVALQDEGEIRTPLRWGMAIDKARAELGWNPVHKLLPGIAELIGCRLRSTGPEE